MGLAPGPVDDMYLGCTEDFGLLEAITFLAYYFSCYDHQIPPMTLNCFCDNLGVITMLTNMQQDVITQPNDTTMDDCNLYLEISAATTQCHNLSFQYLHMKGHQDNDPQWHLTVTEQHNVDCNWLAKQYVSSTLIISYKLSNPAMEAAQLHLLIDGKVTCHSFIATLCQAAASP